MGLLCLMGFVPCVFAFLDETCGLPLWTVIKDRPRTHSTITSLHAQSHCSWMHNHIVHEQNREHPQTKTKKKPWNNTPTTNPSSMAIICAIPKLETTWNMTAPAAYSWHLMRNDSQVDIHNGNDLGIMLAGIHERFASGKVCAVIRLKHERQTKKSRDPPLCHEDHLCWQGHALKNNMSDVLA